MISNSQNFLFKQKITIKLWVFKTLDLKIIKFFNKYKTNKTIIINKISNLRNPSNNSKF